MPRRGINIDPPLDESECFRCADRAAVGVVYLLTIEAQASDAEVH